MSTADLQEEEDERRDGQEPKKKALAECNCDRGAQEEEEEHREGGRMGMWQRVQLDSLSADGTLGGSRQSRSPCRECEEEMQARREGAFPIKLLLSSHLILHSFLPSRTSFPSPPTICGDGIEIFLSKPCQAEGNFSVSCAGQNLHTFLNPFSNTRTSFIHPRLSATPQAFFHHLRSGVCIARFCQYISPVLGSSHSSTRYTLDLN